MEKINVFYDAHTNALVGYTELVKALLLLNDSDSVVELFTEFPSVPDKEFTVKCFDGVAVGMNQHNDTVVIVKYPQKHTLTEEQMNACLEYRGLPTVDNFDRKDNYGAVVGTLTYGDIMMKHGEVIFIHHIRK